MSEVKELQWGEEYIIRGVDGSFPGQHIAAAMNAYTGGNIEYPVAGEPIKLSVPLMGNSIDGVVVNALDYVMDFIKPDAAARIARWFADKYGEAPQ